MGSESESKGEINILHHTMLHYITLHYRYNSSFCQKLSKQSTKIHHTTPHYTTLYYTTSTLHCTISITPRSVWNFPKRALKYTTHHPTPSYTTIHHNTPHYTTLHHPTPPYTTLHHTTPHYTTVHFYYTTL